MSALPDSFIGTAANDTDAQETREWLDALQAVIGTEGPDRAHYLLERLIDVGPPGRHRPSVLRQHRLRQHHPGRPGRALARQPRDRRAPAHLHALERDGDGGQGQPPAPGDGATSAATSRASRRWPRCSASASTTSGTPRPQDHGGDLLYIQGHSSPGIYARAFLEGRLTEQQLLNFRQEVDGKGISTLSAPEADAGVLAVPDRLDGPRAR